MIKNMSSNIYQHLDFNRRNLVHFGVRESTEWYLIILVPSFVLIGLISLLYPHSVDDLEGYLILGLFSILGALLAYIVNITSIRRLDLIKISTHRNHIDRSSLYWTCVEAFLIGIGVWLISQDLQMDLVFWIFVIIMLIVSLNLIQFIIWAKQKKQLQEDFLWAVKAKASVQIDRVLQTIYNVDGRGMPIESKSNKMTRLLAIVIRSILAPVVFITFTYITLNPPALF